MTDELAEDFFGPTWSTLDSPLRYQLISYVAGHEAMHAWEIAHGYQVQPGNTLRGVVANILADIRGDHLPIMRTLTRWPINRDIAYRILFEPLIPAADLEPADSPHADALRVLSWGLGMLRCGRLRCTDGTIASAPTDQCYAGLWPQVLELLFAARLHGQEAEPALIDKLLDLIWTWTREEQLRRGRYNPDEAGATIIDNEASGQSCDPCPPNPLYWQDNQPAEERTDFERNLRDELVGNRGGHECHRDAGKPEPPKQPCPWTVEDAVEEIAASPLRGEAEAIWEEAEAQERSITKQLRGNHPAAALSADPLHRKELLPDEWSGARVRGKNLAHVRREAHLIQSLATQLSTVLQPLLAGMAFQCRPRGRGSRLDLDRQASRIYLHATHGGEQDPAIWLDPYRCEGATRLAIALVVDCSSSMLAGNPAPATACHVAAASLLGAAAELNGRVEIALAGFTEGVRTVRGFNDPIARDNAEQLLAKAQALGGGTLLEPAVAWALAQLERSAPGRNHRRMLIVLTDAFLGIDDRANTARRLSQAPPDVFTVLIGFGALDQDKLQRLIPTVVVLPADQTEQLPVLLNGIIENEVRSRRRS
ncbi:VWA domain-containing protein [Crossiella sp. SN42]|uniref:vWA domain-containing protein n=1 Tax=Crossiella sp. SN42 TaxID=2944808 RepID=UPI00207C93C0|nr:vWA domain-containing protein [Crossiella sp. SN42]MCO1581648.1 VWA domain-containing protein [Crossiella sp. SN42]